MIKITKREKLLEARQPVAVDYFLIHGRIYNDDETMFYKFSFVLAMDLELDMYDSETETDIPYKEALETLIDCFCDSAWNAFDDDDARAAFFEDCNETIRRWNRAA